MHVAIAVVGSRGDVQPMLALSLRLRDRGHQVTFCAPPDFEAWITQFGFSYRSLGRDFQSLLDEFGPNLVGGLRAMRKDMSQQFATIEDAARTADILVGASVVFAGPTLSEQLGIPFVYVAACPVILPSRSHPSPACRWQNLPQWANSLTWRANNSVWNVMFRKPLNQERARRHLAPIVDVWSHLFSSQIMIASEPALATIPQAGQRSNVQQTGAWFFPESELLPPALESFLRAGPPPVYIGFGSMPDPDPALTTRCILDAVRSSDVRAVISEGGARLGTGELPPDVMVVGATPHGKLFPRLMAVVHHGGAGTVANAARAGVPQVIVPHMLDQFFWADRLHNLGISPPPIPRARLSAQALTAALQACVADGAMRERSRALAPRMIQDGIERSVSMIESLARARGARSN